MKMQSDDAQEKLRRENEELRAQLATLRGGSNVPVSRSAPMISLPEEAQPRQPAPPVATVVGASSSAPAPQTRAATPSGTALQALVTVPSTTQRTPTPTRPASPSALTHTVAPKETLYGISTRYYGNGRQVDAIYQANRDQMRSREDVRPGMTLKLPNVDGAAAPLR
jgi:nucleoid-associated protein YgaU